MTTEELLALDDWWRDYQESFDCDEEYDEDDDLACCSVCKSALRKMD